MYTLPNELLLEIFRHLDLLSKMKTKTVCKEFNRLILIQKIPTFTLYEDTHTYTFMSISEFINHIYDSLIETELNNKTYHLTRMIDVNIVFNKTRVRNRYKYYVDIEANGRVCLRFLYEAKSRRYKCYQFAVVKFPALFFVIGVRFMMKIYNLRRVDYNFDIKQVPELFVKMLKDSYRGDILPILLQENISLT